MATCRVCRGEYNSEHHSCPRCGTEVARNVVDGDLDQIDFYLSWLIIPVLLITAVTTLIWFMLYLESPGKILFHPIFAPITVLGVAFLPAVLHSKRWRLWEQKWMGEIFDRNTVSLDLLMLGSLFLFLLTGLGSYALIKFWGILGEDEAVVWWQKLVFSSVHASMWMSLMAMVALFRLDKLLKVLHDQAPHPIYATLFRLKSVVCTEALKALEFVDKHGKVLQSGNNYGVFLVVKQNAKLQFRMTFGLIGGDQKKALARPEDIVQREQRKQWEIVTDRWGRIKSLQPKNQVYVVKAS